MSKYFYSEYRKIRTRNNSVFGHFLRSDTHLLTYGYFVGSLVSLWLLCGWFVSGLGGLWVVSSFTANANLLCFFISLCIFFSRYKCVSFINKSKKLLIYISENNDFTWKYSGRTIFLTDIKLKLTKKQKQTNKQKNKTNSRYEKLSTCQLAPLIT